MTPLDTPRQAFLTRSPPGAQSAPGFNADGVPGPTSQYFGVNILGVRQLRDKLPREVFGSLAASIRHGKKLECDCTSLRPGHQGVGNLSRGDPLHPLVPAPNGSPQKSTMRSSRSMTTANHGILYGDQLIQSEPTLPASTPAAFEPPGKHAATHAWKSSQSVFIVESTALVRLHSVRLHRLQRRQLSTR